MRFSVKKITIKTICNIFVTRFFSTTAERAYRLPIQYQLRTFLLLLLLTSHHKISAEQLSLPVENLDTMTVQSKNDKSLLIALSKQTSLPSSSQSTNDNSVCDSPQPTITFNPQTIFDESEAGIIFFSSLDKCYPH
jgi:hypothetical protein